MWNPEKSKFCLRIPTKQLYPLTCGKMYSLCGKKSASRHDQARPIYFLVLPITLIAGQNSTTVAAKVLKSSEIILFATLPEKRGKKFA